MGREQRGRSEPRCVRRMLSLLAQVLAVAGLLGAGSLAWAEPLTGAGRAAADPALESYLPTIGLKGKLQVTGSETMQQLLTRFASEFKRWYPGVTVSVETEGSAAGFEQFLEWSAGASSAQTAVILASSRPLQQDTLKAFTTKVGSPPVEVQIALGAVAIYVHETNPLREMTLEQLDAMFGAARKRGGLQDITRWGQLGLKGDWEQKPIHLYGRDKQSGTRSLFKLEALLDGEFKPGVKEEPGASTLVLAISDDPLGIGYAGILYQQFSTVKVLALAEKAGKPFVKPSAASVVQDAYPMGRKLFLYAKKAPNQELAPIVREFLEFANSREGQEIVVQSGFYPLPASVIAKNLASLGGAKGK